MFKKRLRDSKAIADFIITYSPYDVDEELIEEYFHGCHAILKKILIEDLKPGDFNQHVSNEVLEKCYAKLPVETMPPLVVEGAQIIDGHHRWRVARRNKIKELLVYQIISE